MIEAERIKVLAEFENGGVVPRIFKWHNKNYKIKEVCLSYQEREGNWINYLFSAETAGGIYKLKFSSGSLLWTIEEIQCDI